MNIKKTIDDLNYDIWETHDDISFYYTDSTVVKYVGLYYEGSDIRIWDSENYSEDELNEQIVNTLSGLINRFEFIKKMITDKCSDED